MMNQARTCAAHPVLAMLAAVLIWMTPALAQVPCRYTVEYIPNPPPCQFWDRFVGVTGISPNGRYVCGAISDCNLGNYAVVVDTQPPGGGAMQMTVIPRPPGVTSMQATGVNDKMEVCGTMKLSPNLVARGFLWRNGQVTYLGVPDSAYWVEANAINNMTEITGLWCCSPGNRAYLWRDGQFTTLDLPLSESVGFDIGENSQIVGYMNPYGVQCNNQIKCQYEAFLWSISGAVSLGALPNGTAWARSIAPNGDVAGYGLVPDPNSPSGSSFRAFLRRNGQMLNLGLLPGATSSAASSTNGLVTVGTCGLQNSSAAFVFANGAMYRLEELQPSPDLIIYTAHAIGDNGSIAAHAQVQIGGPHQGIILRPVWSPVGDINADCKVSVSDLLGVINSWGACGNNPFCSADLNHDGVVNHLDLLIVIQHWGQQT